MPIGFTDLAQGAAKQITKRALKNGAEKVVKEGLQYAARHADDALSGAKQALKATDEIADTTDVAGDVAKNLDNLEDAGGFAKPVVVEIDDATTDFAIPCGNTTVYQSIDELGNVQYIGITDNLERRAAEQLREKAIEIDAMPGLQGLSRDAARAVEQVLIERYGLGKNGGTLLNKINSIAKNNPIYDQAIALGNRILGVI